MYLNLPGHFCLFCCEFKSGHMCIDDACILCCAVHLNATTCVWCARWDICVLCCGVHLNACCAQWDICGTLEPAMRHTLPGNWGASHWNAPSRFSLHLETAYNTLHWATVFQIWCKSVKWEAAVRHCYRLLASPASGFHQNPLLSKREFKDIMFFESHISKHATAGWKQIWYETVAKRFQG